MFVYGSTIDSPTTSIEYSIIRRYLRRYNIIMYESTKVRKYESTKVRKYCTRTYVYMLCTRVAYTDDIIVYFYATSTQTYQNYVLSRQMAQAARVSLFCFYP
jgi:hypothetical protein